MWKPFTYRCFNSSNVPYNFLPNIYLLNNYYFLNSYFLDGTFLIESVSVNSAIGSSPCKDGQVAIMVTG